MLDCVDVDCVGVGWYGDMVCLLLDFVDFCGEFGVEWCDFVGFCVGCVDLFLVGWLIGVFG